METILLQSGLVAAGGLAGFVVAAWVFRRHPATRPVWPRLTADKACAFRDGKGRLWKVRITAYEMEHALSITDVDLGRILADDMQPLGDLLENHRLFAVVMYCCCHRQCLARGVSDEDFLTSILGDPLVDAARAFQEAIVDTFPTSATIPLVAALSLQRQNAKVAAKRTNELMTAMTREPSRSRWPRLLEWTRKISRHTNSAA